jgi:hypothetical protein
MVICTFIYGLAKTWLSFLVDDFEEHYKVEKIKRQKKSLMSLYCTPKHGVHD